MVSLLGCHVNVFFLPCFYLFQEISVTGHPWLRRTMLELDGSFSLDLCTEPIRQVWLKKT